MRLSTFAAGTVMVLALALVGCSAPGGSASSTASSAPSPTPSTLSAPSATTPAAEDPDADQPVVGTVVRFTAGDSTVDVTIGEDSPATRDFLSMLPMTLELEEFNGREKIAYPPRDLNWEGSPGSDPEDGDLIYFTPWGNLGFYYNTSGIDYSEQTLHLGTYNATEEELSRFEGQQTSVEIVE